MSTSKAAKWEKETNRTEEQMNLRSKKGKNASCTESPVVAMESSKNKQTRQGCVKAKTQKHKRTIEAKTKGKMNNEVLTEAQYREDQDIVNFSVQSEDQDLFDDENEVFLNDRSRSRADSQNYDSEGTNHSAIVSFMAQFHASQSSENEEELSEGEILDETIPDDKEIEDSEVISEMQLGGVQATQQLMNDRERQELIGETIAKTMKQLMQEGRLVMDKETIQEKEKFNKGKNRQQGNVRQANSAGNKVSAEIISQSSGSELTLYENAVKQVVNNKRGSSSSEDGINTSDDSIDAQLDKLRAEVNQLEMRRASTGDNLSSYAFADKNRNDRRKTANEVQPSTSRRDDNETVNMTPQEKSDQILQEAERFKARVFQTPGKVMDQGVHIESNQDMVHTLILDERYLSVASHVDLATKNKVVNNEYVDFSKLLPRDRVQVKEDQWMQFVSRGGMSFFVPVNESSGIHSFGKWEQAFRVFSDIYTRAHPGRSSELIQYNHTIYTASLTFIWDNVYLYDKDFRIHLAQNPSCSWAMILQQAWSLRLREKH